MLNESLVKALSDQVTAEYYSAYLYMSMAAYCDQEGFKGFSNWMLVQAKEELAHGTHMFQHMLDRGALPLLSDVRAAPRDYGGLVDVFDKTLQHERSVTASINSIASLAISEGDHATYTFIQWYINEQVEEESTASLILQKLKFIGDNASMLYSLDAELGARVFVDPFAAAGAAGA